MSGRHFLFLSTLILLIAALTACAGSASPATGLPRPAAITNTQPPPAGSQPIQVAVNAEAPPFAFQDPQSQQLAGFDIDLLRLIGRHAGLAPAFTNLDFDLVLSGVAACQYDAAASAITITPERQQSMLFSDPYFNAGQVVVVQAGNTAISGKDQLPGKHLGVENGTTGAVEAAKIANANVTPYNTPAEALQALSTGQLDAVILDNALALEYLSKHPKQLKIAGQPFTREQYGIAVCPQKAGLLAKINQGLAAAKAAGELDALVRQWITAASP